jgi:hypothetical protein
LQFSAVLVAVWQNQYPSAAAAFKFRILRIFEVLINEHPINKSFFKLMLNKQPLIKGLLKKRSDFCRSIIFILCRR